MKLTRHVYATPAEKRRDRIIGFFGWYIVNGVLAGTFILVALLLAPLSNGEPWQQAFVQLATLCGLLLPWVINVAGLIYFGETRSQIALGGLWAIGILLLLSLVAGIVLVVYCFISLSHL